VVVVGAVVVGTGSRGTAGAEVGGGAVLVGCVPKPLSRMDLGAVVLVDIIWSTNERKRNAPPPHQLALVSRLPACRMPMKASGEELAPPKLAASPPPFPLCRRIAPITTTQSMIRRVRRKL
jgi:hypothetical protein